MNSKEIIKSKLKGDIVCNIKGYVNNITDNLIKGIETNIFEDDFQNGNGNELKRKCLAVHSSSILCVNNFGVIKNNCSSFNFMFESKFNNAKFERKFYTGISSPNLDFVLENDNSIIAFESKFLEILNKKQVKFADSYSKNKLIYLDDFWFKMIESYRNKNYYLDVAQLLKHTFGMIKYKTIHNKKNMILVYIYWMPKDYSKFPEYEKHKEELELFNKKMSKQNNITFVSMTYSEYWDLVIKDNKNMKEHICNVRSRYDIKIINNNF